MLHNLIVLTVLEFIHEIHYFYYVKLGCMCSNFNEDPTDDISDITNQEIINSYMSQFEIGQCLQPLPDKKNDCDPSTASQV